MSGKGGIFSLPDIKHNGQAVFDVKDRANIFARKFAFVSSNANYSESFHDHKEMFEEANASLFEKHENDDCSINADFTMQEFLTAIKGRTNSSPGKDEVCYIMFKHMSVKCLHTFLRFFNMVWRSGEIPLSWKSALVTPILKPGKDKFAPESYRPIALTSNLSKLLERMVSNRIYFFMESKGLFNIHQAGFRKGKRTLDHLVRLSEDIRRGLATGQYTVGVFLDIHRAYDMVWKKGLLYKIFKLGISGNTFNFINSFLHGRRIQVRLGRVLSDQFSVENGVPQGSVISPLLFILMINDLDLGSLVNQSLFADDTGIWKSHRNLSFLQTKVQNALDCIGGWCDLWGFKVSVEKTKVIVFAKRPVRTDFQLVYDGRPLEIVKEHKFLGIYFDNRLSWGPHISCIVTKCLKGLNLLRVLSGRYWGSSKETLCYIYKAVIRPIIDYGCEIYASACPSILGQLDCVQTRCLRVCTGALQCTAVASLEVDCGVMPLDLRRQLCKGEVGCFLYVFFQ